jgi:hypothetical protein
MAVSKHPNEGADDHRRWDKPRRMLSTAMNGFYGLKQIAGNIPVDAPATDTDRIAHPDPQEAPLRSNGQGMRPKGIHAPASFPSVSNGTA